MKQPKPHPGGPRGRQKIGEGVFPYCLQLQQEQVKRVDELRRTLGIDSRSEMVRVLIEKGIDAGDWAL